MLCVCDGNHSLTVVALNRSRARQQAVLESHGMKLAVTALDDSAHPGGLAVPLNSEDRHIGFRSGRKTLGAGFLKHGHQVMLGSRDPQKPEIQHWLGENPTAARGNFLAGRAVRRPRGARHPGARGGRSHRSRRPDNFAGKNVHGHHQSDCGRPRRSVESWPSPPVPTNRWASASSRCCRRRTW